MAREPSNLDMLAWFTAEECEHCQACGEHARVSVEVATLALCLACGAVFIDDVRIDHGGQIEA